MLSLDVCSKHGSSVLIVWVLTEQAIALALLIGYTSVRESVR